MKRKLKVYEGSTRDWRAVSQIRLQGKWLEDFGFTIGARIQADCSDGRLVITLDEDTEEQEAKT